MSDEIIINGIDEMPPAKNPAEIQLERSNPVGAPLERSITELVDKCLSSITDCETADLMTPIWIAMIDGVLQNEMIIDKNGRICEIINEINSLDQQLKNKPPTWLCAFIRTMLDGLHTVTSAADVAGTCRSAVHTFFTRYRLSATWCQLVKYSEAATCAKLEAKLYQRAMEDGRDSITALIFALKGANQAKYNPKSHTQVNVDVATPTTLQFQSPDGQVYGANWYDPTTKGDRD